MALTVHKFPIEIADDFTVDMPAGAKVLCVQTQGSAVMLWAIVDPGAPTMPRRFALRGTGHPLPDFPGRYVGTFQMYSGGFVGHLFEQG